MNNLQALLKKLQTFHPLYGDRLAMHLPMVLIALSRLHASDDKLNKMFEQNLDELESYPGNVQPLKASEISCSLGQADKFAGYLAYFREEIARCGIEKVVGRFADMLVPGLAASAFHAIIRLAYALEINDKEEVAISLAFWCAEYQPLDISEKTTQSTLTDILAEVAPIGVNYPFSPGIIVDRMNEIAFQLKAEECLIQPKNIHFDDVRRFALLAFFGQDEFTLLHTVTGCHAFSRLLPFIKYQETGIRELWKAIVVAYLSTGFEFKPVSLPNETLPESAFHELGKLALKSEDSHKIKLYYTCLCEYQRYREPAYYWVAKRELDKP